MASPKYDFDFRQLEGFCRVAELGSFSRAAEALFLAQATISERIANLEASLELKLLDRLGREIRLTRAGELFYRQAVKLLEMKRLAAQEMQFFSGLKTGQLSIGGSTIPGEYLLPGVISRFQEGSPGVGVELDIADSRDIEQGVLEGRLELGVVGHQDVHPQLVKHALWQDELVVLVSAQHPWSRRKDVSREELLQQPFLVRERGSGTLKVMEQYLDLETPELRDRIRILARMGSSTAVKEGVLAGLGVSVLSVRAVQNEIKLGLLSALRIQGVSMLRHFCLIQDGRRTASPICQAFVTFALEQSQKA